MSTREELSTAIAAARAKLTDAQDALKAFEALAENNVFDTLDQAEYRVESMLERRAFLDCEGAGNCGLPEYTQAFMVAGVKYVGTLKVEYNRHDKTYYYIDGTEFSYAPAA